jgi:hypothetical protein
MLWLMVLAASMVVMTPGHKRPAIGVYIDFDAVPSARSVEEMKREAGKILDSAGYFLDWRALKQNQGKESFAKVVVVKFHGKCQLEYPLPGASDQEVALASTMVDRGHVLPFSDVQCDQVRKALPYATTPDRQKAFGLALGRVVAHELYHFLADKTRHAAAGLASASHDWLELVSGTPAFREQDMAPIVRPVAAQ